MIFTVGSLGPIAAVPSGQQAMGAPIDRELVLIPKTGALTSYFENLPLSCRTQRFA